MSDSATELLHVNFRRVLQAARANNALILVDAPPILPVADARLIAPLADAVLLVVAAGKVRPTRLRSALERLELAGASVLGIVLNGSSRDPDAEYYYEPAAAGKTAAR